MNYLNFMNYLSLEFVVYFHIILFKREKSERKEEGEKKREKLLSISSHLDSA